VNIAGRRLRSGPGPFFFVILNRFAKGAALGMSKVEKVNAIRHLLNREYRPVRFEYQLPEVFIELFPLTG